MVNHPNRNAPDFSHLSDSDLRATLLRINRLISTTDNTPEYAKLSRQRVAAQRELDRRT